jgi:hypothetical protein
LNIGGRFGDLCVRIIFTDTILNDKVAASSSRVNLAMALGSLQSKKLAVKAVPVKKTSKKGPARQYLGKNPTRNEKLLATNQKKIPFTVLQAPEGI